MNARQETVAVKRSLIEIGFSKDVVRVGHDTGTAAAWLNILVNQLPGTTPEQCEELAITDAQRVTGRHGDYNGLISVRVAIEKEEQR